MRTNHDDTEYEIQRKQRSQTEGLGLFAEAEAWAEESMVKAYTATEVLRLTSHPDSVAGQSQNGRILAHLQSVGPLTSLDALTLFGCSRLAARIADLRAKGYRIQSRFVTVGADKRVSEYSLLDK